MDSYFPDIARVLTVVNFIVDGSNVINQWGDQIWYLQYKRHIPWGVSHIFLLLSLMTIFFGSAAVIVNRHARYGAGALLALVIIQGMVYGAIFDRQFFLDHAAIMGGLLWSISATGPVIPQARNR